MLRSQIAISSVTGPEATKCREDRSAVEIDVVDTFSHLGADKVIDHGFL